MMNKTRSLKTLCVLLDCIYSNREYSVIPIFLQLQISILWKLYNTEEYDTIDVQYTYCFYIFHYVFHLYNYIFCYYNTLCCNSAGIAQSVERLATAWKVLRSNPVGARFSAAVQTGRPSGYRVSFPGVRRPGRGLNHPTPSSAEVKIRA